MNRLQVKGVSVEAGASVLLQPSDMVLASSEMMGVIGPNGAGKSTLLKAIAQLVSHTGECLVDDRALEQMPARERSRLVAYLGQIDGLQWPIAVEDLVALGRHPYRGSWWRGAGAPDAADRRAIDAAMRQTDTLALRGRRVDTLSGGERARVRLARALAVQAPVMLFDEPIAALDPRHQLEAMALLREQCEAGAGIAIVLHDLTLASRFCDRVILLDRGRVIAAGRTETVLNDENLRTVYGIEALHGAQGTDRYVLPWSIAAPR